MYLPKIKIQERYRHSKDKRKWYLAKSVALAGRHEEWVQEAHVQHESNRMDGEISQSRDPGSTETVNPFDQAALSEKNLASIEEISIVKYDNSDIEEESPKRNERHQHTKSLTI